MATLTSPLNSVMFTSELMQMHFNCTGASMLFAICLGTGLSDEIFSQTYYPDSDGKVTVYDIDKLLEPFISSTDAVFTFVLDHNPLGSVDVVMCRADIEEPAETFLTDFFMTTSMGERDTALGRHETLSLYAGPGAEVSVMCRFLKPDGSLTSKTVELADSDDWDSIDASPSLYTDSELGTLISYEVRAGNRKASYRVLPGAPDADPAFIFRNAFNCWETIYLTGSKQCTPSYTRSSALIEGRNQVYDIAESMSFKARTGPLRPGMVPVALDLARSKDVFMLNADGSAGRQVTITDVDVKHTNEDHTIPDFSFTYRLSSRRTALIAVNRPPRLFDDTFADTYE